MISSSVNLLSASFKPPWEEQDKSSDIKQQPPFGDRKIKQYTKGITTQKVKTWRKGSASQLDYVNTNEINRGIHPANTLF